MWAEDGKTDLYLFFIPPYDERLRRNFAGVLSFYGGFCLRDKRRRGGGEYVICVFSMTDYAEKRKFVTKFVKMDSNERIRRFYG